MKCYDYMIDWDNLPMMTSDKLRFNRNLFEKQAKCLWFGNWLFGFISIVIVCFGFFVVNKQGLPGHNMHIHCHGGNEWIYVSLSGNIFGTLH